MGSGSAVGSGATVSTGPINDISIDVQRPRSGEDAREVRDRRLNTHRDRIEPYWRFWLGGHFAQLRARLARLASVDTTSDGKNRWSWLLFLLGRTSNRPIPPKISNFRLFAHAEIMRIRFFQTVRLCSSVIKNRLRGRSFVQSETAEGRGELLTRIDLSSLFPEGIVRFFSQDLVLFPEPIPHFVSTPLVFAEESQRTLALTTNIGLAKPASQRTSAARSLAEAPTPASHRIVDRKRTVGFDPTLRH